jgi:chromate transporter
MVILNLFLAFFRIGLFAVGGAYSFLPLIEREVVEKYHWLTPEEFLEVLGLVKILPGAISIKYATYTGYKVAGIPGVIMANLGNLFVPVALVILASVFYFRYRHLAALHTALNMIQLVVLAMIVAVAFKLVNIQQLLQFRSLSIIIVSFFLSIYTKIHPALIIIAAGIIGLIWK